MEIKRITLLLVLLIFGITALAQNTDANIFGHVIDKQTHEHLPYVNVSIKGTTKGSPTDDSGHFFITNLTEGKHVVEVSSVGYITITREIYVKKGESKEMNFEIEPDTQVMNDVVVSASRVAVNRKEAAVVVNVMRPKTLEQVNAINLAEGLNYQPGLRVENTCQNCGTNQLRINGLEGKYSQILIDSRPVFSALAGVYGLEQIPVSMIDRIEVIRGGGSALFGANAIGGVVNIITREPIKNSLNVGHTAKLIDGKSWDNMSSFNAALVSSDFKAGAYIFGTSHNRQGYDRDSDGFTELGKQKAMNIGTRAFYKFGKGSKITAEYHSLYEFRRGGDSIDFQPHLCQVAEQAEHHINGGGLTYDYLSKDTHFHMSAYGSLQNINRDSYYGTQYDLNAYGMSKDFSSVLGSQALYNFNRLIFMPSTLMAGVEWSTNHLTDEQPAYKRYIDQHADVASAFLQNEWKNKSFGLLFGIRVDKHSMMNKPVFSPRANVRWAIVPSVTTRLSYSSGFRAPQVFDEDLHIMAVGGDVAIIVLSPDLRPEYSHSFSGSIGWERFIGPFDFDVMVEGFYTVLNDVFVLRPNGTDEQGNMIMERCNGSGAHVGGVNIEAQLQRDEFVVQIGYTYQQSRYTEPETWSDNPDIVPQRRMFRTPDSYGYITVLCPITERFKASVSGIYTGSMLVQHYAGYVEKDCEKITSSFFDMGLKLTYDIPLCVGTTLQISGGIQNIFDSYQDDFDKGAYRDAGYIYGPTYPRTYFMGLKLSL
jgi:Outer membrane receptor for ferrienterochelin and colicins